MSENIILSMVAVGLIGLACQWLAAVTRLPAILYLLLSGLVAGPISGWLNPDALLGDLLFPFVSLAVAVILFEGSLTLRFKTITGLAKVVHRLVGIGAAISWTTIALAVRYLIGLSWELSILMGALLVVTGPTVVQPLLRAVRPTRPVAEVLRWEGIVIDPIGAILTVLVFEFIISSYQAAGHVALTFGVIVLLGSVIGIGSGWLLGYVLRRHWVPDYLQNVAVLNAVLGTFVLSNHFAEESGLLAVTLMGITMANMPGLRVREILHFKETLTVLLISALFVLLAARIELGALAALGWGVLGVLAVIQFVGRPLKVALATYGSVLRWQERVFIAWIGPRGIVAAAVSALFALRLSEAGVPHSDAIVPLTFSIIVGTVLFQSLTARPLARWLEVAEPDPNGVLIVGANAVARAIAGALKKADIRVQLVDSNWRNVRRARMEDLNAYYGNALSDEVSENLDLGGIGRMLAITSDPGLNALAALHYSDDFGRERVYGLRVHHAEELPERLRMGGEVLGRELFDTEISYTDLANQLNDGSTLRSTRLSTDYSLTDLMHDSGAKAILLFAISPKGTLQVFTPDHPPRPEAGWLVISLQAGKRRDGTK
ncbi:MAG: sodium:proton antiporter [Gammaproteobacteria bacterium]|nr:sodium:proton antiporter [Gammaproteobacteria bacterium]MCP5136282.1 sodium:proton antiporter [Gammaproteobacteria bacterium]